MIIIEEADYLAHYGTLHKSGRYPWGSGETQSERNRSFLDTVDGLRKQGLSDTEIARGFSTPEVPFTTTMLRASKTIALNEQKQGQIVQAVRLQQTGMSNVAIGREMGINESSVRSLLAPANKDKVDVLQTTAKMLKDEVNEKGYIDVGTNVENHLGISKDKLRSSVALLQEEGYKVHYLKVKQLGTGKETSLKVLSKPDVPYSEVYKNRSNIQQLKQVGSFSEDGGRSFLGLQPPLNISSSRVSVKYAEQGGKDADGVIYVRPGVKDVDMGASRYAQVRIAVDGTHYLKGMAIYKDDLPDGVDLQFNTNKHDTGNKLDALKPMKRVMLPGDEKDKPTGPVDLDNPFGAIVRQRLEKDSKGNDKVTSALNIVGAKEGAGEEGGWDSWSRSLSSQFLSKQSPTLIKTQLDVTYDNSKKQLETITALTNPSVRKKLLQTYADATDSSAVHLEAAAFPNQATHVILPVNSLKDHEIYAPNYKNGDRVALVRYPHGGTFEIPELTVNNRNQEAQKLLGKQTKDAVGINSKVAERLSGADFDGDTVVVIPNNQGKVRSTPALEGLKNFDPQIYKIPAGSDIPKIKPETKQHQMGEVTNLIADMTLRGASTAELARAVRHSMVVIDSEKHNLNYKESARVNGISQLKQKYQVPFNTSNKAGASTLITRASSEKRVAKRTPRSASEGGAIDRVTGKKVFTPTGESFVNAKGKTIVSTEKSTKLAEVDDAHTLSSGTVREAIYADHSNRLKALADTARLEYINTKTTPRSKSAATVYAKQVSSLDAKLNIALRNAPLERQAQILANAVVATKKQANPDMSSADRKKIEAQAQAEMRTRTGASKQRVEINDDEWEAIQAGAISPHKLTQILNNADMEQVKKLATPRTALLMTSNKTERARQMLTSGYTQAEVAQQLGVSLTTLKTSLEG